MAYGSYTDSLRKAVATPYPPYVEIGTHKDGEWVQQHLRAKR